MRYLGLIAKILASLMAIFVLLYLIAVVINWGDQPPTADYLRLKRQVEERPAVADDENGFVYLAGMAAAPEEFPEGVGARRNAWFEEIGRNPKTKTADPVREHFDYKARRDAGVKAMFDACTPPKLAGCPAAFAAAPPAAAWPDSDRLLLERYRTMIRRPGWREVVPTDVRAPLIEYQNATAGLRMQMLALRDADAATLREELSRDHAFWRGMLASADLLIGKMIAVAGIRQHFYFGNLLLRDLPPAEATAAIPDSWRQEMTRAELSFDRVMAAELAAFEGILRNPGEVDVFDDVEIFEPKRQRPLRRMGRIAARPFYQPQDVINHVAADYVAIAKAFDVPVARLPGVARELSLRAESDPYLSRVYDVTGDHLRQWMDIDFGQYGLRVGTLEGLRRAALTTAELRASGVPPERMAAELANAPLKNPFDGQPFAWDAKEFTVVYLGPEIHAWRRVAFAY